MILPEYLNDVTKAIIGDSFDLVSHQSWTDDTFTLNDSLEQFPSEVGPRSTVLLSRDDNEVIVTSFRTTNQIQDVDDGDDLTGTGLEVSSGGGVLRVATDLDLTHTVGFDFQTTWTITFERDE